MKPPFTVLVALLLMLGAGNVHALTYLPEDAARGGMWANVLVDAGDEYKDGNGNFNTGGGWDDPHNLLGPIPENQHWYAPVHTSIVTMNHGTDSWAVLSFADQYGNTLRVNDDPTNPGGFDGIAWGNAFYVSGGPPSFAESGTIYLSQDGATWWKLKPYFHYYPYASSRVHGDHQTFDHTPGDGQGLVSPGAPKEFDENGDFVSTGLAGGDAFDMATAYYAGDWLNPDDDDESVVGLDWFSYILVTGEPPISPEGIPLYSGPDCDSVYVFSTSAAPVPVPAGVWLLGSGLAGLIGLRRKLSQ